MKYHTQLEPIDDDHLSLSMMPRVELAFMRLNGGTLTWYRSVGTEGLHKDKPKGPVAEYHVVDGYLHREDGPAYAMHNHTVHHTQYRLFGVALTKNEWNKHVQEIQGLNETELLNYAGYLSCLYEGRCA